MKKYKCTGIVALACGAGILHVPVGFRLARRMRRPFSRAVLILETDDDDSDELTDGRGPILRGMTSTFFPSCWTCACARANGSDAARVDGPRREGKNLTQLYYRSTRAR